MNSGISFIKIGRKRGNPVPDLFHFGGTGKRCIISSSEESILYTGSFYFLRHSVIERLPNNTGKTLSHSVYKDRKMALEEGIVYVCIYPKTGPKP